MAGKLIGKVAREAGLNPRTLRYYERLHILPAPRRSPNGYRIYDEETQKRLVFIAGAKSLGLTLGEIRQIIEARDAGRLPCDSVRELLSTHVRRIDGQIAHLRALKSDLRSTLGRDRHTARGKGGADGRHDVCPLIESVMNGKGKLNAGGGRRDKGRFVVPRVQQLSRGGDR